MPDGPARTFAFTVVLAGEHRLTVALTDALYAAGCDDCTPNSVGPIVYLRFDREAPSLVDAVGSALRDIERAGYTVAQIQIDKPRTT